MSDRLRVLMDARMLIGGFGGVSRFVTCLIDQLARNESIQVIALCGDESPPLEGIESVRTSFSRRQRTAARRLLWEERNLPGIIRRVQPDVYHATWNTGVPARCKVPTILTLHDLIPLHRPAEHFATWSQQQAYRFATRRALRRATHITTVSQYVADEVMSTYAIDPQKITVIPNGVDPPVFQAATVRGRPEQSRARKEADESATPPSMSTIRKRPPNDEPFVLYVGGHEPRKNVAGLLRAMRHYWQNFDPSLQLHLTGKIDDLDSAARAEFDRSSDHCPSPALQGGWYAPHADIHPADCGRIRFLGRPNDAELAAEYHHASALLLLSIDEGFGLPVLEAMAHGCPVIAANRASLPEVAGEAALLVNPDRPDEVAAAINQLCHDRHSRTDQSGCAGPSLRQRFIDQGRRRAAQFTWQKTAARFAELYYTVRANCASPNRAAPVGTRSSAATLPIGVDHLFR